MDISSQWNAPLFLNSWHFHTDHLSGASVETDSDTLVVEVIDYYPFGSVRIDEKYKAYENDYKFTGYELDESGLNYAGARYYDSISGRFVSQDPVYLNAGFGNGNDEQKKKTNKYLGDPQGLNSYSYVRNNPLRLVDPDGEWFKEFFTGRQSWGGFQMELGEAAMHLGPVGQSAMDNPVGAGLSVGVLSGAAFVGGTAALSSAGALSTAVKIKAGVGSTLNMGNEILENKVRGEEGSVAEYGYAGFAGAAAANLPSKLLLQAGFLGTTDYVGQTAFDNNVDNASTAITVISSVLTNKLFAVKSVSNLVSSNLQQFGAQVATSLLTETAPKMLNFGVKNSLR